LAQASIEDRRLNCQCAGIAYRVNRRAKPHQAMTDHHQKAINRSRSVRARLDL
jgi:hypothetical protein